jgi:hypothetical protein
VGHLRGPDDPALAAALDGGGPAAGANDARERLEAAKRLRSRFL